MLTRAKSGSLASPEVQVVVCRDKEAKEKKTKWQVIKYRYGYGYFQPSSFPIYT
jgi:hypothetical protein